MRETREGVTRIDRSSRWGNPYRIGNYGLREEVIERYKKWLKQQIRDGEVTIDDLLKLGESKFLGCWCKPKACHGDVLLKAIEWARKERKAGRR